MHRMIPAYLINGVSVLNRMIVQTAIYVHARSSLCDRFVSIMEVSIAVIWHS